MQPSNNLTPVLVPSWTSRTTETGSHCEKSNLQPMQGPSEVGDKTDVVFGNLSGAEFLAMQKGSSSLPQKLLLGVEIMPSNTSSPVIGTEQSLFPGAE